MAFKSATVDSKELQQVLLELGGDLGSAGVDGKWGPKSIAALKAMSMKYGVYLSKSVRAGTKVKVTPDSVVVLLSGIRNIEKGNGLPAASESITGYVYTVFIQQFLNKLGYLPANQIDKKFGKITQGALVKASSELGAPYKSSSAFLSLLGVALNPAVNYLVLYRAAMKGIRPAAAPQAAAAKPEAAKPAPTASGDPDTWPELSGAPKQISTPTGKAGQAYVSKDVQYLLYSIQKQEGVNKASRITVDGLWGKKSSAVLVAIAKKYGRKVKAVSYFNKSKSVIVNPADLVPALYNALVTLRQGGTPSQATEVPPPAGTAPATQPKPTSKAGNAYNSLEVQNLLISLGASIKNDGIWGPKSRAALKDIASKNSLSYKSSSGFGTKNSQVLVNPPGLIESLHKVLADKRSEEAKQAAIKAAREAIEKQQAEVEAAAKKRTEEKKAAEEAAAAEKEKQVALLKIEEAKKAEEAAKRVVEEKKAAAQQQAQQKAAAAKKAAQKAKAAALKAQKQKAQAAKKAQEAAKAAQESKEAVAKAAVTKAQATEVIIKQQAAQPVYAPSPVYQPGYTSQAPITTTLPEEEVEVPQLPATTTPSIPMEPTVAAPTPMNAGLIIAGAAVLASLGIVAMSRKPKGPLTPPRAPSLPKRVPVLKGYKTRKR